MRVGWIVQVGTDDLLWRCSVLLYLKRKTNSPQGSAGRGDRRNPAKMSKDENVSHIRGTTFSKLTHFVNKLTSFPSDRNAARYCDVILRTRTQFFCVKLPSSLWLRLTSFRPSDALPIGSRRLKSIFFFFSKIIFWVPYCDEVSPRPKVMSS